MINSVEGANHGTLPHSSQPILGLATVTDRRGCCVKTVNCHFSNDGHLDGCERLRSALYGLVWVCSIWFGCNLSSNVVGLRVQAGLYYRL